MLIITAVVAYVLPIFFSNCLLPICINHIANINSIDMVNNVPLMPLKNPVPMTRIVNNNPALDGRLNVQLVRQDIQLLVVVIVGFLLVLLGIKYPGNHIMSKPNGIEQMIFHNGIFIVRARKKHAHNPIIDTPSVYNDTSTSIVAMINPKIAPKDPCNIVNNHIWIDVMLSADINEIMDIIIKISILVLNTVTMLCRSMFATGSLRMARIADNIVVKNINMPIMCNVVAVVGNSMPANTDMIIANK